MIKNAEEALTKALDKMPKVSFENEHGEKFNIHSDGTQVFMSGDEVNMMVDSKYKIGDKYIALFNDRFNIWSKEELSKLGDSLKKLMEKI